MKVVGMQKREMTSKKTGNKYEAAIIHCEKEDSHVMGIAVESVFTTADRVPSDLTLGDEIQVLYNRYGNVEAVKVLR